MDYQDINAQTIDSWIRDGWEWGKPSPGLCLSVLEEDQSLATGL